MMLTADDPASTPTRTWTLAAEPARFNPDRRILCDACREIGMHAVFQGLVRLVDHYAQAHR